MKDRVFAWIRKYHMIQPKDRVVTGVSGGADSVCLLYMLLEYQKEVDFEIAVVHVNHGLRGEEARRDEAFVEEICKREELPYFPYHYDVAAYAKKEHLSEEEAGRVLRYQAFAHCMGQWQGTKIALAHHKDDQAETILYHLFRGSSLTGLCGIRPVREEMIRPLLCMKRDEIEHYLQNRKVSYVVDSTNAKLDYTRNKIRHRIVAYAKEEVNEKATEHICRAAEDILEAEQYLQMQADLLYQRYVQKQDGYYELAQALFTEPLLLVKYVLRRCLGELSGLKDITREHIGEIIRISAKEVGKECMLPQGIRAWRTYDKVLLGKKPEHVVKSRNPKQVKIEIFPYKQQRISEKTYTKWFDYDKIKNGLIIRTRCPGDYLTVNAAGGKKKLKDYLIDCKVPRQERDSILVAADGSHILWVVGYRISEYYKVTDQTKQILEIRVEGGNTNE